MEEEFYASLKLSTGEEVIAKVSYMTDEDSLLLDRPLTVERVIQKRGGRAIEGFHLKEWMMATYDTMFVVNMKQVVTITELDTKIEKFYLKHLSLEGAIPTEDINSQGLNRDMGYLGSVRKTKESLENIFNNS